MTESAAYTSVAEATTGLYAPQQVCFFYGGKSNITMLYDPVGDTWSTVKARPTSSWSFGVAVVDDVFYVIGGFTDTDTDSEPLAVTERYVPLGYQGDLPSVSAPVSSSGGAGFSLNNTNMIVAVLVLIVGVVVAGVFFFISKRGQTT
jgi:hypothetical protein